MFQLQSKLIIIHFKIKSPSQMGAHAWRQSWMMIRDMTCIYISVYIRDMLIFEG